LVLAVSLDGRLAPPGGGPAQIGGSGDRRALEEALAWADGCLIGGRTLRLHGTTCLIHALDLLEQRASTGRSAQPTAVVVSRSGRFEPQLRFFQQPLQRWCLAPGLAEPPAGFDRAVSLTGWLEALESLAAAGLQRLVLLGGAELAGALLAAQLVDQLQLTLCPLLLGGAHSWLPPAIALEPRRWRLLEQRLFEGDELLLRYGRITG
jgi:5-amino-6-(5-phosphoribosylamino)uracil reductase